MKKHLRWLLLLLVFLLALPSCTAPDSGGDSRHTVSSDTSSTIAESTSDQEQSSSTVAESSSDQEQSSSTVEESASDQEQAASAETDSSAILSVDEGASYTDKDEVALYIHIYGKLPVNYITKKQAEKLGWDSDTGNLQEVAPGKSIGGGRFGNYEGILPKGDYKECDIDYDGGYRNGERIVYSSDGKIYYTGDHYKTFEELY